MDFNEDYDKYLIYEKRNDFKHCLKLDDNLNHFFRKEDKYGKINIDKNENLQYLLVNLEEFLAWIYSIDKSFNDNDLKITLNYLVKNYESYKLKDKFIYFEEAKSNLSEIQVYENLKNELLTNVINDECGIPELNDKIKNNLIDLIYMFFLFKLLLINISKKEFVGVLKRIIWFIDNRSIYSSKNLYLNHIQSFFGYANENEVIEYLRELKSETKKLNIPNSRFKELVIDIDLSQINEYILEELGLGGIGDNFNKKKKI